MRLLGSEILKITLKLIFVYTSAKRVFKNKYAKRHLRYLLSHERTEKSVTKQIMVK